MHAVDMRRHDGRRTRLRQRPRISSASYRHRSRETDAESPRGRVSQGGWTSSASALLQGRSGKVADLPRVVADFLSSDQGQRWLRMDRTRWSPRADRPIDRRSTWWPPRHGASGPSHELHQQGTTRYGSRQYLHLAPNLTCIARSGTYAILARTGDTAFCRPRPPIANGEEVP